MKSAEYLFESGGYEPLITFLNKFFISLPLNGGLYAAISYITQPSDHTSLLKSYG